MTTPQLFEPSALEQFAVALLAQLGMPAEDAALTAQALVQSDLEGVDTHGLGRLPNYIARLRKGLINAMPQMVFVRQVGATALLDADNAMGQIAATRAMREAMKLAGTYGVGWVAVRNSGHFGAASFYCRLALEAGMIGIALSNSPPGMAPYGGREAALGTNPISIAIPTGEATPISIDLATSAVARGNITKASRDGTPIPPNWALDSAGQPTTDPDAALQGALLPMAGAKGYGLALAIETLCGILTGGAMGQEIPSFFTDWEQPANVGHQLIALNIGAFIEPAVFRRRADTLIQMLKAVLPAEGHTGVLIPGERRAALAAQRRQKGVPLAPAALQQLNQIAAELGIAPLEGKV